jgi:hypothetical protein
MDEEDKGVEDHMEGFGVAFGAAMEAGEIVPKLAVFALDRESVSLADEVFFWQQNTIGLEAIGCVAFGVERVAKKHFLQTISTTTTRPESNDVAGISVNSQPYPDLEVFSPT